MASLDYSGAVPTSIRIAQFVGLASAASLTGAISNFSIAGTTAILNAPLNDSDAARTWHELYLIGARLMPKVMLIPTAAFSYLAYDAYTASALRLGSFRNIALGLYIYAAVAIPAIAPYTLTIMADTNAKLMKQAKEGGDASTRGLLEKWYGLNLARSTLVLSGLFAGAWAVFGGLP